MTIIDAVTSGMGKAVEYPNPGRDTLDVYLVVEILVTKQPISRRLRTAWQIYVIYLLF